MIDRIVKQYTFSACGIYGITANDITIDVEDQGTVSLKELTQDFDGKPVKILISYDEAYAEPKSNGTRVL